MVDSFGNLHKFLGGHRGRLYQKGHVIKNWKPRFFVLEKKRIKCYADETLFRMNGELVINDDTLIYDIPGEVDGRKFVFYISAKYATSTDEVLYLSAQSLRDKLEWMEAITDSIHNGFKLVDQPEIWTEPFYPCVDVCVSYARNTIFVEYGNMLKPSMVEAIPSVSLRFTDPNGIYSLILVDLDSVHSEVENKTAFLHWGIVNISGSDLSTGVEVAPYRSPAPEYDSGLHRYFFLVFSQNFVLTSGQMAETAEMFQQQREQFCYSDWVRSRNLGDPVGLNGFYAGWEEYCNVIHERLDYNPPEDYLLRRQDIYLQKEAEAIWVEDAKMQLFQDLTLGDMFPPSVDTSTPAMVGSLALVVQYDDEIVSGGVTIAPEAAQQAPLVSYTPHQGEICGFMAGTDTLAVDFGLYALLLVDLDAATKSKGSSASGIQEFVHWVVLNIPQSSIPEGVTVLPYVGPKPARGTGLHRYVFSLYKQKKAFSHQQIDSCRAFFSKRAVSKSYDWIRSQSAVLLNVPVGVEAFLAEWDESVGVSDASSVQKSNISLGRSRHFSEGEDSFLQTQSLTSSLSAEMKRSGSDHDNRDHEPSEIDDEASRLSSSTVSSDQDPNQAKEGGEGEGDGEAAPPKVPAIRTGFGSVLIEADHDLFDQAAPPTRFVASNKTAAAPLTVAMKDLRHGGAATEDLSKHHERKASHSPTVSEILARDSKEHDHVHFHPKPKHKHAVPSPATPVRNGSQSADSSTDERHRHAADSSQQQQQRYNPFQRKLPELRQLQDIHNSQQTPQSRSTPDDQSPASEAPGSEDSDRRRSSKTRASDEVEWLREQEAREKRDKKKLLLRQREEELTRFEATRIQEERRRADQQVLEERRRISQRQEEEADRLAEEKRRKMISDAEKLKKQEEMRRAMQEHERAEAERVRLQEAKFEEERQRAAFEQAEEQRRLEQRQLEEQQRALQRQRDAEAAELERQQLIEARQQEERRRQKQQRADEEAQRAWSQAEAQRQEEIRRQKMQQMSRMDEEGQYSPRQQDYGRPPQLEERGRFMVRRQQDEVQSPPLYQQQQPYSPQQRPGPLQLSPYPPQADVTSPGRLSSPKMRHLPGSMQIDAPTSPRRYSGSEPGLQSPSPHSSQSTPLTPALVLPSSLSSASSDTSTDGAMPGVEYESESVSSKQQRSVSFATVISSSEDSRSSSLRSARKRERAQRRLEQKLQQEQLAQQEFTARQQRESAELQMYQDRLAEQQRIQDQGSEEDRRAKLMQQQKEAAEIQRQRALLEEQQQREEQERLERARAMAVENMKRDAQYREQQRLQQQALDDKRELDRTLALRRQEEEATMRKLQEEAEERAAEEQRQLEEQQYEEQMRLLHLQLEDEHASQVSHGSSKYGRDERSLASRPSTVATAHDDESIGVWGAAYSDYDEQQQILYLQQQAEAEEQARLEQEEREHEEQLNLLHQQLLEEHLDYFNEDEKDDREVDPEDIGFAVLDEPDDASQEPRETHDAYEQPKPATNRRSLEHKISPTPSSLSSLSGLSPQRDVQVDLDTAGAGPASNPSRERTESESSGRSRTAESANRSPPSSPPSGSSKRSRTQSGEGLQQIVDGVAQARNSADLCVVFGVRTRAIFDGDKLVKKFSSDFMFKESAVWIDPQKRSFHWGKKPLDAANSKFIQLEPYSKSNPSIPAHMRPVGENKGTCKSVELVDQANFKITLWSGKVFEAKVVGETAAQTAEKTGDYVKVINSFQRRP